MGRPVTKVEITLQQIADSLVEIRDLLQQASPSQAKGAVSKAAPAADKPAAKKASATSKKP